MDTSGHDAFVKGRAEHFINQDVEEQGLTKRIAAVGKVEVPSNQQIEVYTGAVLLLKDCTKLCCEHSVSKSQLLYRWIKHCESS